MGLVEISLNKMHNNQSAGTAAKEEKEATEISLLKTLEDMCCIIEY
jgi:hypothetical protein